MYDAYIVSRRPQLIGHYPARLMFVGDYADQPNADLDAMARSGDYFIMLATKLETIAAELPETSTVASSLALSQLAEELGYMQQNYILHKRSNASRRIV